MVKVNSSLIDQSIRKQSIIRFILVNPNTSEMFSRSSSICRMKKKRYFKRWMLIPILKSQYSVGLKDYRK